MDDDWNQPPVFGGGLLGGEDEDDIEWGGAAAGQAVPVQLLGAVEPVLEIGGIVLGGQQQVQGGGGLLGPIALGGGGGGPPFPGPIDMGQYTAVFAALMAGVDRRAGLSLQQQAELGNDMQEVIALLEAAEHGGAAALLHMELFPEERETCIAKARWTREAGLAGTYSPNVPATAQLPQQAFVYMWQVLCLADVWPDAILQRVQVESERVNDARSTVATLFMALPDPTFLQHIRAPILSDCVEFLRAMRRETSWPAAGYARMLQFLQTIADPGHGIAAWTYPDKMETLRQAFTHQLSGVTGELLAAYPTLAEDVLQFDVFPIDGGTLLFYVTTDDMLAVIKDFVALDARCVDGYTALGSAHISETVVETLLALGVPFGRIELEHAMAQPTTATFDASSAYALLGKVQPHNKDILDLTVLDHGSNFRDMAHVWQAVLTRFMYLHGHEGLSERVQTGPTEATPRWWDLLLAPMTHTAAEEAQLREGVDFLQGGSIQPVFPETVSSFLKWHFYETSSLGRNILDALLDIPVDRVITPFLAALLLHMQYVMYRDPLAPSAPWERGPHFPAGDSTKMARIAVALAADKTPMWAPAVTAWQAYGSLKGCLPYYDKDFTRMFAPVPLLALRILQALPSAHLTVDTVVESLFHQLRHNRLHLHLPDVEAAVHEMLRRMSDERKRTDDGAGLKFPGVKSENANGNNIVGALLNRWARTPLEQDDIDRLAMFLNFLYGHDFAEAAARSSGEAASGAGSRATEHRELRVSLDPKDIGPLLYGVLHRADILLVLSLSSLRIVPLHQLQELTPFVRGLLDEYTPLQIRETYNAFIVLNEILQHLERHGALQHVETSLPSLLEILVWIRRMTGVGDLERRERDTLTDFTQSLFQMLARYAPSKLDATEVITADLDEPLMKTLDIRTLNWLTGEYDIRREIRPTSDNEPPIEASEVRQGIVNNFFRIAPEVLAAALDAGSAAGLSPMRGARLPNIVDAFEKYVREKMSAARYHPGDAQYFVLEPAIVVPVLRFMARILDGEYARQAYLALSGSSGRRPTTAQIPVLLRQHRHELKVMAHTQKKVNELYQAACTQFKTGFHISKQVYTEMRDVHGKLVKDEQGHTVKMITVAPKQGETTLSSGLARMMQAILGTHLDTAVPCPAAQFPAMTVEPAAWDMRQMLLQKRAQQRAQQRGAGVGSSTGGAAASEQ